MRSKKIWEAQYEHDLILAFWLAVDKEDTWLASILMNFDPSIRFIATLALNRKKESKTNFKVREKEKEREREREAAAKKKSQSAHTHTREREHELD